MIATSHDNLMGWPLWNWTAAGGMVIGWIARWFVFRCRHEWIRRADLDHLFHLGANKRFFWSCSKCGKFKSETCW